MVASLSTFEFLTYSSGFSFPSRQTFISTIQLSLTPTLLSMSIHWSLASSELKMMLPI